MPEGFKSFEDAFSNIKPEQGGGPENNEGQSAAPKEEKKEKKTRTEQAENIAQGGTLLLQRMGLERDPIGEKISYPEFFELAVRKGWVPDGIHTSPAIFGSQAEDAFKLYFGGTDKTFSRALDDAVRAGAVTIFTWDKKSRKGESRWSIGVPKEE